MSTRSRSEDPDLFEVRVPVATLWTGPEAPRDVDRSAVIDDPDVSGWTSSMDAAVRKGLDGRTLTQLLIGEPVQVDEERGEWVRVRALWQPSSRDATGYPGWMRRAHLGKPVRRTTAPTAWVMAPKVACDVDGQPVELSCGTGLVVESVTEQSVEVLLPGDRRGTVPRHGVRLSGSLEEPAPGVEQRFATARQFLGLRYLWGGTSAWGLDCSGLVHLTFRAHGQVVPRDAFDQAAAAEPVPLDEVRPGDLYFFARPGERVYHVGFVTRPVGEDGSRWMLHAPESGELIEDAPLAPHRTETLVSAGRVG